MFQLSLREDKANRLSIPSEGRNNTHTWHLCLKATCQLYSFLAVLMSRCLNDRQELFIQLNRTFAKYYRSFCVLLNVVQVTKLKNNKQHLTPREYKHKGVVWGVRLHGSAVYSNRVAILADNERCHSKGY